MRLDCYGNLAEFGHALFRGILRILVDHALLLYGFRPVLFEDELGHPFLARPTYGLLHNTTTRVLGVPIDDGLLGLIWAGIPFLDRLVLLYGQVLGLEFLHRRQWLSRLDRLWQLA